MKFYERETLNNCVWRYNFSKNIKKLKKVAAIKMEILVTLVGRRDL